MVSRDGMAQPVFKRSDARAENYTNASSEFWCFCVCVESEYDTDLYGKCDLMKVCVQVPRAVVESGESGWKAPVLYEARSHNGGMNTDLHGKMGLNDATSPRTRRLHTRGDSGIQPARLGDSSSERSWPSAWRG